MKFITIILKNLHFVYICSNFAKSWEKFIELFFWVYSNIERKIRKDAILVGGKVNWGWCSRFEKGIAWVNCKLQFVWRTFDSDSNEFSRSSCLYLFTGDDWRWNWHWNWHWHWHWHTSTALAHCVRFLDLAGRAGFNSQPSSD